jgi:NTE family protein
MNKIGLALGGGGAKGLAHIPILEVFDEMEIELHCISGTSAGAIIGALYASGMKAVDIRSWADDLLTSKGDSIRDFFQIRHTLKTMEFFDLSFHQSGLLKGTRFLEVLGEALEIKTFEKLKIPLRVVASDYWQHEQVVFKSGKLLPAIRASMGLPGIFTPLEVGGRILIDGGGVNPVPHDILDDCDIVIAVDVMGFPSVIKPKVPNLFRSIIGMFDVMQYTIIEERLKASPPNLYLKPDLKGFDLLDFHESEAIYEQSESAVQELQNWLMELLESL